VPGCGTRGNPDSTIRWNVPADHKPVLCPGGDDPAAPKDDNAGYFLNKINSLYPYWSWSPRQIFRSELCKPADFDYRCTPTPLYIAAQGFR
jgi:hypothetical protein